MADAREGMPNALVIGASGLVGGALMRALESSGWGVTGTRRAAAIPDAPLLDIRDQRAVHQCIDRGRPDVVFLAVNVPGGVDYCEDHPAETRALFVDGTRHVVEAVRAFGARLVVYSTDYIFDGAAGPYSEEAAAHPLSVYGQAKWDGEQLVRQAVPEALILRTTAVYGWDRLSKNFAMQVWQRLGAGQPMQVPEDQWGHPTLADYLAEISVRLAQAGASGVVNVVGRDLLPRAELARALAKAMALDPELIRPLPTAQLGQRAPRPLRGGLTTDRLTALLGTEPPTLTESLNRFRRRWRADTYTGIPLPPASDAAGQLKRRILDEVRAYYTTAHGAKPFAPFQSRVPYAGRVFGAEEMVNLVDSALDFWLTLGPYGDLFESRLKRLLGVRDALLVNSGSTANLTAVLTLMSRQLPRPLEAGDEVITPAVTFPTTLAPLVHAGLVPVIVDCEVGTYNINPALIAEAVSPRTRAIMVPHTLGNPCDMAVILEVARQHELFVVEDCCDALLSRFDGRPVGTFGDLATLSFFPAHHITMGEGGAVLVNRPALSRIARSVRDWGRDCWCAPGESNTCGKRFGWQLGDLPKGYDHKYVYSNLGYNFKPTDMQAAIGVAQLERLPTFVEQRRRNFQRLYHGLQPYQDFLVLPRVDPRAEPSWFGFPITVKPGLDRQVLIHWLEQANIETRQIFAGNILRQPGYRHIKARVVGSLEQTDRIMRDAFFLGVYPGLSDDMLTFLLARLQAFFRTVKWRKRDMGGRATVIMR